MNVEDKKNEEYIRVERLYNYVIDRELKYDNLSSSLDVEILNGDKTDTYSALLRIKKDSIVWISIRSFNIEGVRLAISKDSIKMIDRINNSYYYDEFDSFAKKLNLDVDYKSIEAILTNSFFFYPCSNLNEKKLIDNFKSCIDHDYYCISSLSKKNTSKYFSDKLETPNWEKKLNKELEDTVGGEIETNNFVFQIMKILPETFKIKNVFLENYFFKQSLYISYDNFIMINDMNFPQIIEIEFNSEKFSFFVKLSSTKIEFDKIDIKYPIKYTTKMTKLDFMK